jgi:hypothetical protein
MLLYIGNTHSPIPTVHSVHRKETYEYMDLLLRAVIYSKYGLKICGDLKVIGSFLGM